MMRLFAVALTLGLLLAMPGMAAADHPAVGGAVGVGTPAFQSGGDGAEWESLATFVTGNPHSDLDFFTQGRETFVSVGTLGNTGPNSGGQTILQLTRNGQAELTTNAGVSRSPAKFVSGHPSAFIGCPSNPLDILGLQHDIESTPKGNSVLNTANPAADRRDTQLLIDASDAPGRCHDGGTLGILGVPQGGLEIVDVTDVENPVEIGLISHIGESHTVNVDPRRPHIVYSVTSDAVNVATNGTRANENPASTQRFNLDGFEVADISSCMNFAPGTETQTKREECRPEVYRYRYPSAEIARGTVVESQIYGCHELEVYPNDRLTCGGGAAMIYFDIRRAFDNNGTPRNFRDDTLNGEALDCNVRPSTSLPPYETGAMVTDCVVGEGGKDLTIPAWIADGSPSLEGVQRIGTAHHMGRGGPRPSTEDNDFDHEAELTHSGKFILATDERGGGVVPPGATCATGVDNLQGNGALQAHVVSRLDTTRPETPEEADDTYARMPDGEKAFFRATPRTGAEATTCTAHVFQQIPGQNRIFMGWYSQGTQVIDYYERPDGTLEFREAGYFIPVEANHWVSHIFKFMKNADGSFTYYGAAGDFAIAPGTPNALGRNAIEIFKVTLPAPQLCAARVSGQACRPGPVPSNPSPTSTRGDVGVALAGLLVLPTAAFIGRRRRQRRTVTAE